MISLRRRRAALISAVAVVLVGTGLVVALEPDESTVDATTSSAPEAQAPEELPTSFQRAWARPLPVSYEQVVVDDGYIAIPENTGVRVHELRTGRERWRYLDSSRYVTRITAGGGTLLMVSTPTQEPDYQVQAFDLDTGEVRTTVPLPDGDERGVVAYGEYFLVTDPYRMYSLDGRELWSRAPESCEESEIPDTKVYPSTGGPLVLMTGCLPSEGPYQVHLVGVRPEDGGVLWRQEMSNVAYVRAAPSVLPPNAPILLRSPAQNAATPRSDHLVAIDPASGRRLSDGPWSGSEEELTSVPGGWCVYLWQHEAANRVSCYDAATGTEQLPAALVPVNDWGGPNAVRIFPVADGAAVVTTTVDGMTVDLPGTEATGFVPDRDRPVAQYYGPGALVTTSRMDDGRTELSVYTSAEK